MAIDYPDNPVPVCPSGPIGQLITIDASNIHLYMDPVVDGERKARGLIPRDFAKYPPGYLMCAKPFDLPLIDESEWADRIRQQEADGSSLQHIRNKGDNGQPIPALDQNGQGFCWAYSSTGATMMIRAANNQPYVRLSAHMVGCIIKGYRDEGGWGSASVEFIAQNGVPTVEFWQEKSMSRSNDTPAMRANAKAHCIVEWMDCSDDSSLRRKQVATALLCNMPVVADFNFWSHSVCLIRLMSSTKTRLLNSWSNAWSENGVGDLEGSHAWPDAALVPRVITPAVV